MTIDVIAHGARVLCAVSGGVDSMYLLHRMAELGAQRGFTVGVERARLRRDLRALEVGDGLGVPDIDRGRVASAIVAAAAAGEARHAEHDGQEDGYDSSDVCLHFLHLLSE